MSLPIRYIDDAAGLQQSMTACRDVPVVTIDTEFVRTNTYYPRVGLIQIYDGETCYLIDPLTIDDLSELGRLLEDDGVLKVIHACSEDLEVFEYCLDVRPTGLFDTQVAAAASGLGFSIGYQAMVENLLGVSIPKEETRSDWLQRPLTDEQIEYAALDVIYLFEVYEKLIASMEGTDKEGWVLEDCRGMTDDVVIAMEPEAFYKRVRSAWRLDRRELKVLKDLCAWREREARARDMPRNGVVDESVLVTLARTKIEGKVQIREKSKITPGQLRKYGDLLVELANEARQSPVEDCPPEIPRPAKAPDKETMAQMRSLIDESAEELNVAPEMLDRKQQLEELFATRQEGEYRPPQSLSVWAAPVPRRPFLPPLPTT
ncbi:MAG: ribonuclease D, partial [Pseudomonadales bacterium]|nr:ribonuclease D [Pseudomonadales bacterium]